MLTKETKIDKIEIVGDFKQVQIRKATIISENEKELSRSFERYVLNPNSDISSETDEIKNICNSVWSDELKLAYENSLAKINL